MKEQPCQSNQQGARGQGYLELALALPVLLVLMMGLIEVALLMRAQLVLTNATREGARLASRGVGDEAVVDRAMFAFSNQLPADLDTNTGIAVTRFYVPELPGEPPVVSDTYFVGKFDLADPTCTSRVSPDYRSVLVAENADFGSPHDVVIVEACHHYHLSFLPITRILYDQTTMRIVVQRTE
jgi:Flp pilus assembly protein TadG